MDRFCTDSPSFNACGFAALRCTYLSVCSIVCKAIVSLLAPRENAATLTAWAENGVTAFALDAVPRMLSRAQV